ncbi:MAG: hypothetical protein ABIE68_00460 [bacterium]
MKLPVKFLTKHLQNLYANKKRFVIPVIVVVVLVAGFLMQTGIANAADWFEGSLVTLILSFLALIQMVFAFVIGYIIAPILNSIIASESGILTLNAVNDGWGVVRDTANMGFILIMLIIAFATVMRIENYSYKALLPRLIFGILLVNFSRTMAMLVIDFCRVLTITFMGSLYLPPATANSTILSSENIFNTGIVGAIFTAIGANTVWEAAADAFTTDKELPSGQILSVALMQTVLLFFLMLSLGAVLVMFIIRLIVLMILIVVSPAAMMLGILPGLASYRSQWWKKLLSHAFYAPIAMFFIVLAIRVSAAIAGEIGGTPLNTQGYSKAELIGNTSYKYYFGVAMMFGLLFVAITAGKYLSVVGANIAGKIVGGGGLFAGGALAGFAGRRIAKFGEGRLANTKTGQRIKNAWNSMSEAKEGDGRIKRWSRKTARGVGNLPEIIRTLPTAKKSWQAYRARRDEDAYTRNIGKGEDIIGKFLTGKKSDFGRRRERALVAEKEKLIGPSSAEHVQAIKQSKSFADKESAWRVTAKNRNVNDTLTDKSKGNLFDKHRGLFKRLAKEGKDGIDVYDLKTGKKVDRDSMSEAEYGKKADEYFNNVEQHYDPNLARAVMFEELGGQNSEQAAEAIRDISEIAGDSGIYDLHGMASNDSKTGKARKTSVDEWQTIAHDKSRKMAGRLYISKMSADALYTERPGGGAGDYHENGYRQYRSNTTPDKLTKMGEHAEQAFLEADMSHETLTGEANHTLVKRRAINDLTKDGGDMDKLQIKMDAALTIAEEQTTLKNAGSADYDVDEHRQAMRNASRYSKDIDSLETESQNVYASKLASEVYQSNKATDESGIDLGLSDTEMKKLIEKPFVKALEIAKQKVKTDPKFTARTTSLKTRLKGLNP